MQNKYRENPQELSQEELNSSLVPDSAPDNAPDNAEPSPPEEYLRMKEWIRQAQLDAERARSNSDRARNDIEDLRSGLQEQGRMNTGFGWTTAILLIALLGACAYGYYALHGQGSLLAQMPGVQKSVDAIGQRMNNAEDQFRSWTTNWDGLTERVGKIEKGVSTNLRAAKDFATEQAASVHHQLQDEMDNRTRSMDAKVSHLESSQQEDRVQLAALQQQVATSRSEAAQQLDHFYS